MCEEEQLDKDWIIQLDVRPNQMKPIDPPEFDQDENFTRILYSVYSITLAETFLSHHIDPYIIEHIQLEKECCLQDDLTLIWSDDISLTLCFLASLAHHGKYDQQHLLQRYFQWWMNGYMCPTGLCFTPHVNLKRSIDLFGETEAAKALGIQIDLTEKTSKLYPTPAAFIRISPIAYFYSKHSLQQRQIIIEDFIERMFGKNKSIEVFIQYIELLVKAINGLEKNHIINSIELKSNSNDIMNKTFFDLIHLLSNDKNNIEYGIQLALEKIQEPKNECQYLNPYDSNRTIILTLYLQLSSSIYNSIPQKWLNNIYAKETIDSLIKWISYQRKQNLHLI